MPSREQVQAHLDLVRSEKDVPIAVALLIGGGVDFFVTNDRDFTDRGATAERFTGRVRVMLTGVFLRDVLGWSPEALESIRNRRWEEMALEFDSQPGGSGPNRKQARRAPELSRKRWLRLTMSNAADSVLALAGRRQH
jgi:hypothetical protein